MDEKEALDFESFCRYMETEYFLFLPAEYAGRGYSLNVERKGKESRVVLIDGKEHLNRMPYLKLYDVYKECGKQFDTTAVQRIFRVFFRNFENAVETDKREQEILGGMLKEFPKERVFFLLVPKMEKRDLMKHFPVRYLGDAVMLYALLTDEGEDAVKIALITEEIREGWSVSEKELHDTAVKNRKLLFPYELEELAVLPDIRAFMVSSKKHCYGLGALLDEEGPLKELSINMKSDLLVLPLSIHEAAVLPADGKMTEKQLNEITASISPFHGQIWHYNKKLNQIAFTKEERLNQEACLKQGILDAAERRMMHGISG